MPLSLWIILVVVVLTLSELVRRETHSLTLGLMTRWRRASELPSAGGQTVGQALPRVGHELSAAVGGVRAARSAE